LEEKGEVKINCRSIASSRWKGEDAKGGGRGKYTWQSQMGRGRRNNTIFDV